MDKALNWILSDKEMMFDEVIMNEKEHNSAFPYSSELQIEIQEYNWVNQIEESPFSQYALNLAASFNDELIGNKENPSREHIKKIAEESLVLLKNDSILPLSKESAIKITLAGPYADNRDCFGDNTLLSVLQGVEHDAEIIYAQGCTSDEDDTQNDALQAEAVWAAEQSDVVILAVGTEKTGNNSIGKAQEELIEAVCGVGKTTIQLNFSSASVDLSKADELCGAIVQCWNANEFAAEATVKMLFGDCQPTAKLPITFYSQIDSREDRIIGEKHYTYTKGTTLYPFGYGLNYSFIEYYRIYLSHSKISIGEDIEVTIFLKNKGGWDTQDVVQAYIKDEQSSVNVPKYRLASYKKVKLPKDEEVRVSLTIKSDYMSIINGDGQKVIEPGRFSLYVGAGQPDENTSKLCRKDCLHIGFLVE